MVERTDVSVCGTTRRRRARGPATATTRSVVLAATLGSIATGCFTDSADFRDDAETFIVEDAGIAGQLGTTFVRSTCEDPASRDVDETFACVGIDVDGREWGFEVRITGDSSYTVNVAERPDGA